jgi:GTP pyrophosphokinase
VLRLERSDSERLIDVQWGASENLFSVDIQVLAYDRRGLLRDVSAVLANDKINVTAVNTRTDASDLMARMELALEVEDVEQLSRILDRISQLANVVEAKRKT